MMSIFGKIFVKLNTQSLEIIIKLQLKILGYT